MSQSVNLPYLANKNKLRVLAPFISQPWSMLLDSAGGNLAYNRFDILTFEPTLQLEFSPNGLRLQRMNSELADIEQDISPNDPLATMRELLKHFQPKAQQGFNDLPFNGGWLGYFSYDFARHLEQLPDSTEDPINLPWLKMGLYQWALITDHKQQTTCLYNFGLADETWLALTERIKAAWPEDLDSQDSANNDSAALFQLTSPWQSNTTKTEYRNAFEKIQNYILNGDCYQVNFAQQFSADYQGDPFVAYRALSKANQAPFSAYLNFSDHQILSLSPERFIESHNRLVSTQPIKGTRPRSTDPEIDQQLASELCNSEKDRAENLMIVDLLRNDLSRTAAKGSVTVKELFGHYQFESVHHLISTIEAKLDHQYDNFDLLATTLPGGSITGAPKIRALEIIEELEPVKRNLYCGTIGYIDFAGNMDSNICIRTLIAKNNKLYCWAGGGLVADSDCDLEYAETFDKLAKILPVLEATV